MKLMNTERKQIMIRVPKDLASRYKEQAESEGYAVLNAWIVSVLNDYLNNKKLTKSQQKVDL